MSQRNQNQRNQQQRNENRMPQRRRVSDRGAGEPNVPLRNPFAAMLPPSPGLSSDSLADTSADDISSFSDIEDQVLPDELPHELVGEYVPEDERNVNDIFGAGNDRPGPSRSMHMSIEVMNRSRTRGQGGPRSNKRPLLSSSSDSCVETGYTNMKNPDSLSARRLLFPLAKNLQRLRANNEFTDVHLVVDEKEIPCHRVVLAACSKYFHALLSSNMKEGREEKVKIRGHKFEVVELIVKHMYAETIDVKVENAQDIVEAADYFQLDALKIHCENFLLQHVAESNCLGLMQFATLHSLDALALKAKRFALRNFMKVYREEEFLRLPLDALITYVSDDTLSVQREEHVFQAVISWLNFDEERTQHLLPILKCVRFLFVSPHYLFDTVAKLHLLQENSDVQELISEACKYHALGTNEWKQMQLPHTKPRNASGITEVLFIVGGICNNRRLHYTEYYHPKRGWMPLADIGTTHNSMHSYSVCAHKNDVYITGGHSNSGTTTNAASLYLSNINRWSELASMTTNRERHGSATVDGAVYVAGGLMASHKGRKRPTVLDSVERYRPAFNRWEKVRPLRKRCYSPGVIAYKEKLYVIGGVSMTDDPGNSSKVILNCIQYYDPLIDRWALLPLGRPLARLCCALYQDRIYMISNNATVIFCYDPETLSLEEWRPLPEPGLEFAGLSTFNGKLVITGGQKENNTLNQMFLINFETKEVVETITMTRSLCMHGCVTIDKFG